MPKTCACRQHTPGVGYFPFNVCVVLVHISHFAWTTANRQKARAAQLEAANLPPTPTVSKERAERCISFTLSSSIGTTLAPTPFQKKETEPPQSFIFFPLIVLLWHFLPLGLRPFFCSAANKQPTAPKIIKIVNPPRGIGSLSLRFRV
jgi:hypothetical protein